MSASQGVDMEIDWKHNTEDLVERIRGRDFWLPELEMVGHGSPLVALLVRLEDVARDDCFDASSLTNAPDWAMDMQRAQTFAAIGRPGNLQERKGHLDPDAFAVEVIRTERARIHMPSQLELAMDSVKKSLKQETKEPVFCFPIVDFDVHKIGQQSFISEIQHFLPESVEVFIVADEEKPIIHRRVDRFHLVTVEEYSQIRKRLKDAPRIR